MNKNTQSKKMIIHHLPGTEAAIERGCTCPVSDNHYGKGWGGNGAKYGWIYSGDCGLHVPKKSDNKGEGQ